MELQKGYTYLNKPVASLVHHKHLPIHPHTHPQTHLHTNPHTHLHTHTYAYTYNTNAYNLLPRSKCGNILEERILLIALLRKSTSTLTTNKNCGKM